MVLATATEGFSRSLAGRPVPSSNPYLAVLERNKLRIKNLIRFETLRWFPSGSSPALTFLNTM
jgi:hypothetical protein